MISIEILVITSIVLLVVGYFKYQKYNDIFKTISSLISLELLTIISVILLSYFSLKFLLNLGF